MLNLNRSSPSSLHTEDTNQSRSAPQGLPSHRLPPLLGKRPPRCPPFVEVINSDQLLPYLEHVARRPYNHGSMRAGTSRQASACCCASTTGTAS